MKTANNIKVILQKGLYNVKKKLKRDSKFLFPSVEDFPDRPKTVFDAVNMYGTFNIQKTADTENEFPKISQGLPKDK